MDESVAAPAPAEQASILRLRCASGHRWTERWSMPMTLAAFSRRIGAVAECPTCGAETLFDWPEEVSA